MVRTTSDKQIQGLKHVMESFTIFTSSAIVDHIFILLSATRLCKMTGYDLQLHLKYRNNIWNKGTEIKYCLCTRMFFMLTVRFTGSLTKDEQNFPQQNSLILQKKVSGLDKVEFT